MTRRTKAPLSRPAAIAAALLLAALPAVGRGQSLDRVRLTDKTEIRGELIALSPTDVEIRDQKTEEPRTIPIDQVAFVAFADEPEPLRNARDLLLARQEASALEELASIQKVDLDGALDNVLTEYAFLKAAATARQATASGGDLAAGEKLLRDFLQGHPKSHHVFRGNEMLGDLLVRAGRFDDAAAAYATLERGPPALKVRAATSKAKSFYEQKKYVEAEREFDAAIKAPTEAKDAASAAQKREAQVGKARCLSRQGKAAEAVGLLQEVIRGASTEDRELLGRTYAVLGDAYRAADKPSAPTDQDALIAFLTVDLVYNVDPDSRAEALYNLVQLWQKVQNPERSREVRQVLETSYPNSRWTRSLGAGGKG